MEILLGWGEQGSIHQEEKNGALVHKLLLDPPMLKGIAGFNVDVEPLQLIEEFKTHLAPSLIPLLASNAANTTINTIEKSAVSHSSF